MDNDLREAESVSVLWFRSLTILVAQSTQGKSSFFTQKTTKSKDTKPEKLGPPVFLLEKLTLANKRETK